MPDFERIHELSRQLAELTAPGQQQPGLFTWCEMVADRWRDISNIWTADIPSTIHPGPQAPAAILEAAEKANQLADRRQAAEVWRDLITCQTRIADALERMAPPREAEPAPEPSANLKAEDAPPLRPTAPHVFLYSEFGGPFCHACGGGERHAIHTGDTNAE